MVVVSHCPSRATRNYAHLTYENQNAAKRPGLPSEMSAQKDRREAGEAGVEEREGGRERLDEDWVSEAHALIAKIFFGVGKWSAEGAAEDARARTDKETAESELEADAKRFSKRLSQEVGRRHLLETMEGALKKVRNDKQAILEEKTHARNLVGSANASLCPSSFPRTN